jgi:hypothetical protein
MRKWIGIDMKLIDQASETTARAIVFVVYSGVSTSRKLHEALEMPCNTAPNGKIAL